MSNGLVMINGLWTARPYFYESKLEYVARSGASCTCGTPAHTSTCAITMAERTWSEDLDAQYAAWKKRQMEREDHQ